MADQSPTFLFAVCQRGVEWALKEEVARRWPQLRFAFSRPGFVTFKWHEPTAPSKTNPLIGSVFARTACWSLGSVEAEDESARSSKFWQLVADQEFRHLHIWQRDSAMPGDHGFAPGPTPELTELGHQVIAVGDNHSGTPVNDVVRPGESVLNCVIVEPHQWWLGIHRVESVPQRWPGGTPKLAAPDDMISRAYLKISEALAWSRLPAQPGDAFVEIGCAPGGSVQALLDRGFKVTGIDPATVDERLAGRPGFTHIRKRGADLKRAEYRPYRWLTADLNVAPGYTLETVENIVTHDSVNILGILLTLKLMDRPLYGQIGEYLARVRSWGYEEVRARQLAFNRQEICIAALQKKSLRRASS